MYVCYRYVKEIMALTLMLLRSKLKEMMLQLQLKKSILGPGSTTKNMALENKIILDSETITEIGKTVTSMAKGS